MTKESFKKSDQIKNDALSLSRWYQANRRKLPWRESKNPYFIWISEVMLQQTTVAAVVPYFDRFIARFPSVQDLARAPIEDVLELWSGLGYYSRARNLHKASQTLQLHPFPIHYQKWLELPGLGPYTARAVTSISFGDRAGVVDGNVIRVLSRRWGLYVEWWRGKEKEVYQKIADELVKYADPSIVNQGLMELGATVCSREKPVCGLCPWNKNCVGLVTGEIPMLPLSKPKKKKTLWLYRPNIVKNQSQILLTKDGTIPVLNRMWMIPGMIKKINEKPLQYDFTHSVTDHIIFVESQKPRHSKAAYQNKKDLKWVPLNEVGKFSQSSLTKKILKKWNL